MFPLLWFWGFAIRFISLLFSKSLLFGSFFMELPSYIDTLACYHGIYSEISLNESRFSFWFCARNWNVAKECWILNRDIILSLKNCAHLSIHFHFQDIYWVVLLLDVFLSLLLLFYLSFKILFIVYINHIYLQWDRIEWNGI